MSSLKTTHRWAVARQNPELEKEFSAGLGIPGLVARIMVAHGITSIEEGQLFLTPSLDRDWADPLVIPGMAVVADRVERAIRSHEHIAVFGDFDVVRYYVDLPVDRGIAHVWRRCHAVYSASL